MRNNNKWCNQRPYAHFDKPISSDRANNLVRNQRKVARHSFWPLIVFPIKSVHRTADVSGRRRYAVKKRPIAYAAHSDSHIYSFYAKLINQQLEKVYAANPICNASVLAYRKFIPGKSNIHFAKQAFDDIQKIGNAEVICLDVEGFFDNLTWSHLKEAWTKLFDFERLPDDHFAVYRACTRAYGISLHTLKNIFGREVARRRGKTNQRVCSASDFRHKVAPRLEPVSVLVNKIKNKDNAPAAKGIPQGLPISAVLANLYMLDTDLELSKKIHEMGGVYRRYSDDILVVVPIGKGKHVEEKVTRALEAVELKIKHSKTQRLAVANRWNGEKSVVYALDDKFINYNQRAVVAYLGFCYDGMQISIRDSTISNFIINATRVIRSAKRTAKKNGERIKKRQLYARLTRLEYGKVYGKAVYASEHLVYRDGIPRAGFFRYMRRASYIMKSDSIKKQIRQVDNLIFRKIDAEDKALRLPTSERL